MSFKVDWSLALAVGHFCPLGICQMQPGCVHGCFVPNDQHVLASLEKWCNVVLSASPINRTHESQYSGPPNLLELAEMMRDYWHETHLLEGVFLAHSFISPSPSNIQHPTSNISNSMLLQAALRSGCTRLKTILGRLPKSTKIGAAW